MATKIDYSKYIDPDYLIFTQKLSPEVKLPMLGIRMPDLKSLAKELGFLEVEVNYNEDVLIQGLMIANLKEPFSVKKEYIERLLIPNLTGWSTVDIFACNNKIKPAEMNDYYSYFTSLLYREAPMTIRLGIVSLLASFIKEKYLLDSLESISKLRTEEYLVRMAIAWYMATAYTKFPDKSFSYFKNLDSITLKMAKQKCRDSRRVSEENKKNLNII